MVIRSFTAAGVMTLQQLIQRALLHQRHRVSTSSLVRRYRVALHRAAAVAKKVSSGWHILIVISRHGTEVLFRILCVP